MSPTARGSAAANASKIGRRRAAAVEGGGEQYRVRRTEIVRAAVALFRERGYRRTSLTDIANAVGTDRASLYYYFSSKEEVLNEAVTGPVLRNTEAVEALRDAPGPAGEKLRALVVDLLASYAEHYPLLFVYLEENLSEVDEDRQAWAAQMREVNRRYVAAVEAIIRDGILEGGLRPLADPSVLANGLMGMVSWTHRWYNPTTSSTDPESIGRAYAELLLGGLTTVTAAGEPGWQAAAHPDVVAVVGRLQAANVLPYDRLGVSGARDVMERVTRLQGASVPVARVEDLLVDGAAGKLPARLFHPDPARRLPLIVYVHGGGWVAGTLGTVDRVCRRLAAVADCAVLAFEYRRAPETPFPGPLDDCVQAVRWAAAHAESLGADDQLVLLGDSAGGNLAAATALVLSGQSDAPAVDSQILVYPVLDPTGSSASYERYADGPLMTAAELAWFWAHYLGDAGNGSDWRAAPPLATEVALAALPDTMVVVAELDPLRDEGLAYAEQVRAAGVRTEVSVYRGAAHGFWWLDGQMQQAGELTDQIGRYLHRATLAVRTGSR